MFSILNEVFHDKTIQSLPGVISEEDVPHFRDQGIEYDGNQDTSGLSTSSILRYVFIHLLEQTSDSLASFF